MVKKTIIFITLFCLFMTAYASSYYIKVNTKKCRVSIYLSDGTLLGTKKCCVGAKNNTPKGEFTIKSKEENFWHGTARYDYVSYFSHKCAFHSTPFENGQYNNSSIGHRRSNGCIRLKPEDAKWIYKYCKKGTKVYVY